MSEEVESTPEGVDPVAAALAVSRGSCAVDGEIIAFLRDQRHHLHEQARHLREQLALKLWELRMGVVLRVATAIVGIAVAGGLGYLVWDAAHSKGLIVEPFNVPSDLAARGLTGEVVAGQMIDKLTTMTKSESSRAVQSYANNWGSNIKVEIPETGISIGELRNFLRDWLGHDIHTSGEVFRTADGIAVTARTSGEEGATFTGKETDLDALMQKAAEHVYEVTQPYRYANYLDRNYDPNGAARRVAKATEVYRKLIAGDDKKEQAWAWNGLGTLQSGFYSDSRKAAWYYRKALATDPDFTLGYYALSGRNYGIGQEEDYFRNVKEFMRRAQQGTSDLNPRYARSALTQGDGQSRAMTGDCAGAIPILVEGAERTDGFSVLSRANFSYVALWCMAQMHDLAAMRGYLQALDWTEIPAGNVEGRFREAMQSGDWRPLQASEARLSRPRTVLSTRPVTVGDFGPSSWPFIAYSHARTGDIAGAEKILAPLADDNATAVRMRAMVAELKGDHARADWWFARSEAQTPSLPLTDLWWGQALLKRGQPDKANEKFILANKKGPKFADPLEGWGEALMAKNQSHLALEKFAEADKYAPNWGRLHLKWGEALVYAGKRDDARAQFARAAQLDLTPSEKLELARAPHV